jgi:hypothetical protein
MALSIARDSSGSTTSNLAAMERDLAPLEACPDCRARD